MTSKSYNAAMGARHRTIKSDIFIAISMALLLSLICMYQNKCAYDTSIKGALSLNYLPSGNFLKGMALGYDEAFADFLWVKTVGYYGTHAKTDQDYTWLIHMLKLTTKLDPRFESPYEFAGLILPGELKKVDEGIAFLKEGIRKIPKSNPRYWLQHFYLGFNYMIYKNDSLQAARQFEAAEAFPQSPKYLPLLISRLYASGSKPWAAIEMIQGILDDPNKTIARNAHMRKSLQKRMRELMDAQDVLMLQNAVADYFRVYHQKPSKLEDLVDGLILPFIPRGPFGRGYYLSFDGGKVYSFRSQDNLILDSDSLQTKTGPVRATQKQLGLDAAKIQ
jgi:hypothetical protein